MMTVVRKLILATLVVGLATMLAMPSLASTFLAMTEEQLVSRSESIVQGEVLRVESGWDPTGKVIMSHAVIRVEDRVKGRGAREIRVETFGGTVGNYTVEASGFPRFSQGDRVLLFVNRNEAIDRAIRVTGYQQGHYRIAERGGVEMAVPTMEEGVRIVQPDGKAVDMSRSPEPLADLKARLRATSSRLANNANDPQNNQE